MSVEYKAELQASDEAIQAVRRTLESDQRYALLPSTSAQRILCRFSKYPFRQKWAEDIDVIFDQEVRVLFHSVDRSDVVEFLGVLEAALATCGYRCTFDEE